MKLSRLILTTILLITSNSVFAEYLYGFGNIYLDHQSWNHGPSPIQDGQNGKIRNQLVLGLEGGAGFTWGELYGFYDRESIEKSSKEQKNSLKGTGHLYLADSGVSLYGQLYHHDNPGQSETNHVVGLGYTSLSGSQWFFKPWIGLHNITSWDSYSINQNVNGDNGIMAGWSALYGFNLGEQRFSLINWNEIEFNRNDMYAENQGGKNGFQGAVILLWHPTERVSTGIHYRYFYNKLGVYGSSGGAQQHYGDALIYRLQYSF
ncbi:outer membrane protein OmpK [Vibrio hangzhouensis]|uniref:outer membrane protein OmpK n=1 Tax=Vibrio hangzhouensis TaxID=462991 RepID=UPI001C97A6B1|nr:outer membrane protein OmpK [Vibrio hangzhouensis]MBY6195979.1 hypothetical protein [Vibrio hangzhouensis]